MHGLLEEAVEALHRQREMGAALRPGDGVDLVQDQGLDPGQQLTCLGGQEQEEGLGGRDQDVGRFAEHLLPLLLGRVAGADRDAELGLKAGERAAEVALDVVVQRLQRRHV